MVQKIVSVKTIKLRIKCILKQVHSLSIKEQKEIINFTLKSIKNLKTLISLNSGQLNRHSLFSKCIAKCKNSDGFYKFVIRRKEYVETKPTFYDEPKSCENNLDLCVSDDDNYKSENESQKTNASGNSSELNNTVNESLTVNENSIVNESVTVNDDINLNESATVNETNNYDLPCSLCSDISNNYTNLTNHILNHNGSAISCYKCKQSFNNISVYKIHLNEDCSNYISANFEQFAQHLKNIIKRHGQKYLKGFFCPYCGNSFVKPFNLKRHLKNICGENLNNTKYSCSNCNKKFDHEVKYSEHLQRHSNYKCLNCDLYFPSKKLLKLHSHSHPKVPKKYTCELCNLEFQNRSQSREHNAQHINDKTLTSAEKHWRVWCNVCHISVYDYVTYKRHCTRKSHLSKVTDDNELLNMKTFMCVKCGQVFMTKDALSTHCSRIHSDRAKLTCEKCSYTTTSKSNMKRHSSTHDETARKNFICDQCPSAFSTMSSLKEHIALVHAEERLFACDSCPKTFKLKNLLNRHKKTHSPALPFVCVHCTVGFKRKSHLKRHTESRHKEHLPKTKLPDSKLKKNSTIIQNTLEDTSKIATMPPPPLEVDIKVMTENIQNDRVFSLIDAQSGELVTLSATELSKNAVINMSGGELLNEVHISELWNPPNAMYGLDPILQNNVLPQPEYNIITHDKNEISHMLQKTLEESNADKNAVQYCTVPPENVENPNELRYFYV